MTGKFIWTLFNQIKINDPFFDTLKADYPEFPEWFDKKSNANEKAFIYQVNSQIKAFLYLKDEYEEIELTDKTLPKKKRLKIGTLKLSQDNRGLRLGEGALGIALWRWQEKKYDEIYLTTFLKQQNIIGLVEKYGFKNIGKNIRGEEIYLKSKALLDYTSPYLSFPFINPNIEKSGILPINDHFHDKLFVYSQLRQNNIEVEEITAGNGITKIYIATPYDSLSYNIGEPLFVYRIHTGKGQKTYISAITSFVTVADIVQIKKNNTYLKTFEEYKKILGNKTVFNDPELNTIYNSNRLNIVVLELLYNGYFGKGNNINHSWLSSNGLFNTYPYKITYNKQQFRTILKEGKKDVSNIIIN